MKMYRFRIVALLLALLVICNVVLSEGILRFEVYAAEESDVKTSSDGIWGYIVDSSGLSVTVVSSSSAEVKMTIPTLIDGYEVKAIGDNAFTGNTNVQAAVISGSISTIGEKAFSGCPRLESAIIGSSVTNIAAEAFADCTSLNHLSLADGLQSIGENAFKNCALTKITIPDSVTSIGAEAFAGIADLTVVCSEDSYAQTFCTENNIQWIKTEGESEVQTVEISVGFYGVKDGAPATISFVPRDGNSSVAQIEYEEKGGVVVIDYSDFVQGATYDIVITKLGHTSYTIKSFVFGTRSFPEGIAIYPGNLCNTEAEQTEIVNIFDVREFLVGYKCDSSSENYLEAADFDENKIINLQDLNVLISNYGRTGVTLEQYISRGEWILRLAEKMEMDIDVDLNDINCYYADSAFSADYGAAIETARAYDILPAPDFEGYEDPDQDVPLFMPDDVATREFAVYTAVQVLGYLGEYEIVSADVDELKHPSQDAIAVQEGLVKLINGYFMPNLAMSEEDVNSIFSAIDRIEQSVIIDPSDYHETVEFAENVTVDQFKDITDYTITAVDETTYGLTVVKNSTTEDCTAGDVLVLPANDNYPMGVALKVVSVHEADGNLVFVCTEPTVAEIYSSISFSGDCELMLDRIESEEGISCVYDVDGTFEETPDEVNPWNIDTEFSEAIPGTLKFSFDKEIKENFEISGAVKVTIPNVTAKLDADIGLFSSKLNDLVFSVKMKGEFEGKLSYGGEEHDTVTGGSGNIYDAGRKVIDRIKLGKVPVKLGATGLSVDLVLYAIIEADGYVSVTYTISPTFGIQYTNGSFRTIKGYESGLESLDVGGKAKLGMAIGLNLCAFDRMDLFGFEAQFGIGFSSVYTPHLEVEPNVHCVDATVCLFLNLSLNEDTALVKLLKNVAHLEVYWEIFTEDNSPLKLKKHIENFNIVDRCSFGNGNVDGNVIDAESSSPLPLARVRLLDMTGKVLYTAYSTSDGTFAIPEVSAGEYFIQVSATGYKSYMSEVTVKENETTYVAPRLMVQRTVESGKVSGEIIDAATGDGIEGVSYVIRDNWDNLTGDVVASGSFDSSFYTLSLPVGSYTIELTKENYISKHANIVSSLNGYNYSINMVAVNTEITDSDLRAILTWGEIPADLDSHLYGPTVDGVSLFHVYFNEKEYTNDGETVAFLDLDDITSYGPETTMVIDSNSAGVYSFYVHDYTNGDYCTSGCTELSNSLAQVEVYLGNERVNIFYVPTGIPGTLWHVFDYDASTRIITGVNKFSFSETPGDSKPADSVVA